MAWNSSAELAERSVSRPVGAMWPENPCYDYVVAEFVRCIQDPFYFINNYCSVKEEVELKSEISTDPTSQKGGRWLRFEMWESQRPALEAIHTSPKTVILKARQLGMTWLSLAYVLWMVLFKSGITALLFSKGDRESLEMLVRFKGMFTRLPPWMMPSGTWTRTGRLFGEAGHTLRLANGSRVISLPANTGDSFTAAVAVVDEADLVEKLAPHLGALKPTVDNGGKLILLSRSNKSKPNSPFKGIYRAAVEGTVDYTPVFLPWHAHPGRTLEWYESQRRDSLATTFSLDQLWEQYPACITAETRVSTEQGIVPICEAATCHRTESGPIVAMSKQPASTIWRLETERGRVLRGTFDHPVMTTDRGFVGIADLLPGERIALRPPMFAERVYTATWDTIPGALVSVEIGPEWGRFIGVFMGDGSWHNDTIEIACDAKDRDVVANVADLTRTLIGEPGYKSVIRVPGRAGCMYVRVTRKDAREVFCRLGLIHNSEGGSRYRRNVCVPECIWRSPKPVVREFLRGVFETDGSASGGVATLATNKQEFARNIQLLLLGFGFNSHIGVRMRKAGNKSVHPLYTIHLTKASSARFANEIGFIGKRKQSLVSGLKAAHEHANRNGMDDVVARVFEDGFEQTYDFTIGVEHVFSANGILTHNTADQALADNQLDKRFPVEYVDAVFDPADDLCLGEQWPTIQAWDWADNHPFIGTQCPPPSPEEIAAGVGSDKVLKTLPAPRFNGLRIYQIPKPGGRYAIGADPAQGMVTSNDSAAVVIDCSTGEEVASWNTKTPPKLHASRVAQIADWYSALPESVCSTMVEQNNHGHAFILWWQSNRNENNTRAGLLRGPSGNIGWTQTGKSKETMYHRAAQRVSDRRCIIHTRQLRSQICSIESASLEAPTGSLDDLAVAWALSITAADLFPKRPWAIREATPKAESSGDGPE